MFALQSQNDIVTYLLAVILVSVVCRPLALLNHPLARYFGAISHSRYLCHTYAREVLWQWISGSVDTHNFALVFICQLAVAIALASVLHFTVERPFLGLKDRYPGKARARIHPRPSSPAGTAVAHLADCGADVTMPCGGFIVKSRRQFLTVTSLGVLGAAAALRSPGQNAAGQNPAGPNPQDLSPGAPPAFGAGQPVGPEVSTTTFVEAEKLVQFEMNATERAVAAGSWRKTMAAIYERRTGPRKLALENTLAPASGWNPVLPGQKTGPERDRFVRSQIDPGTLPVHDEDIAFASVTQLSRWIETRKLTSVRLTNLYLKRLQEFDPKLHCVITLTPEFALKQAKQADEEIAAGKYRGPLHGIPWGGKDLLDTAGIPTTYGAEPFRNRLPSEDAAVVKRLHEAGAVLVAKLSLGALALNDIWFGGQTMNPWLLEEASSGSSAGPGAATAAGLVGFAVGSETGGSIISPSMRCGIPACGPPMDAWPAPEP